MQTYSSPSPVEGAQSRKTAGRKQLGTAKPIFFFAIVPQTSVLLSLHRSPCNGADGPRGSGSPLYRYRWELMGTSRATGARAPHSRTGTWSRPTTRAAWWGCLWPRTTSEVLHGLPYERCVLHSCYVFDLSEEFVDRK